jgi:transcription initiation factor TFIID TATA-box-binding protein
MDVPTEDVLENIDIYNRKWAWSEGKVIPVPRQNVVFTSFLNKRFNLRALANKLQRFGAQYNRKSFAACIFRARKPNRALLVFQSGKIVCAGAKTELQALELIYSFLECLQEKGIGGVHFEPLKRQNEVVSIKLPWRVDPFKLGKNLSAYCTYDPETFPGCIMKHPDVDNVAVLVFHSGKMNITGIKSESDLEKIMIKIPALIKKYGIQQPTAA